MLKKITLLFLFLALVALAVVQYHYLKNTTEELVGLTESIETPARDNDYETAYMHAQKFMDTWNEKRDTFEMFCEHDEVDKIQAAGERVAGLAYQKSPVLLAEINVLNYYLNHIIRIDAFSWDNIF